MIDNIQSMEMSFYLYTLSSIGLVGIKSSQNIYVLTLFFAYSLAITPWRLSCLAYVYLGFITLPIILLSTFLAIF